MMFCFLRIYDYGVCILGYDMCLRFYCYNINLLKIIITTLEIFFIKHVINLIHLDLTISPISNFDYYSIFMAMLFLFMLFIFHSNSIHHINKQILYILIMNYFIEVLEKILILD